jgi:hypothetical protein
MRRSGSFSKALAVFSHSYGLSVDFGGGSRLQLACDRVGFCPRLKDPAIVHVATLLPPFYGKKGRTETAVISEQPALYDLNSPQQRSGIRHTATRFS